MSERHINDSQPTPQAPASVDAAARQLASARRRRFIKLGGAAVPTALTLTSRPVMAWHCNTASTWGSAQGVSTTHSSYTRSRDSSRLFTDETYTLSNWVNNTTRSNLASSPWSRSPLSRNTTTWNSSTYFKGYTVAQLLSGTGATISGVSTADTVWSILSGTAKKPTTSPFNGYFANGTSSCGEFQKLMLVAWLNYKVLSSTLNKCLVPGSTNVLVKLGNTTYVGPTGATWTQADVIKYLKKNFVACHDEACS
jgi:hypothetical protein